MKRARSAPLPRSKKARKEEPPSNPTSFTKLERDHPAITVPPHDAQPDLWAAGTLVAVPFGKFDAWFMLGTIREWAPRKQKAKVFFFEEHKTLEISFSEMFGVDLSLLSDPPNEGPIAWTSWKPNLEESKRLVEIFGTDQPYQVVPWGITEIGVIMLNWLPSEDLLSCLIVCTSWRKAMSKIWEKELRYLAVLQVSSDKLQKKVPVLDKHREIIKSKKKRAQVVRSCRSDSKALQKQQEEANEALKNEYASLSESVDKIHQHIKAYLSSIWFRDQPANLQQTRQGIPAYPFPRKTISGSGEYKSRFYVSHSDVVPPGFEDIPIISSLDAAIENSARGGIIYLSAGTFYFTPQTFVLKYIQIIGVGESTIITASPDTPPASRLKAHFALCSIRFKDLKIKLEDELFSVFSSNVWFEHCDVFVCEMEVSYASSLFLSHTKWTSQLELSIMACTNALIIEDCIFQSPGVWATGIEISPPTKGMKTNINLCLRRNKFVGYSHSVRVSRQDGVAQQLKDPSHCVIESTEVGCASRSKGCKKIKSTLCESK